MDIRAGQSRGLKSGTPRAFKESRIQIFTRKLISGVAAVTVLCGAALAYLEWTESRNLVARAAPGAEGLAERFGETLAMLGVNVTFLSHCPALKTFVQTYDEFDRLAAQRTFVALAQLWKPFDQIRFLNLAGIEVIRVNRDGAKVMPVPWDLLQDKSDREYFREASQIPDGALYISRLDLNVENGKISVPWKPTLRVAAPVFDEWGKRAGIVVINVRGDYLLPPKLFADQSSDAKESAEFLSEDGSWLAGAAPEKSWNFIFKNGYSFGAAHPDVWQAISTESSGVAWDWESVYAFTRIRPEDALNRRSKSIGSNFAVVSPVHAWYVVQRIRRDAAHLLWHPGLIATTVILYLFAAWVSWKWSGTTFLHRSAEQRERTTIARSRDVINHTDVIVHICDLDERILFANNRFCRILGKSEEELIGTRISDAVPPEFSDTLRAISAPPIGSLDADVAREFMFEVGGVLRHFLVNCFPLFGTDGRADSWCAVGIEITELKNIEQSLVAASEAKSRFLANMSHELRTPLNAILGFAEILEEEAVEDGLDNYRDDLRRILEGGRHLLALINDILDFSKIEAGKMDLSIEEFRLGDLLRSVASTAEPLMEKNGNRFMMTCDISEMTLKTDATRLRQILLNLLSNAAKFTFAGSVSLSCRAEGDPGAEMLLFEVTDSGIGMTPNELSGLFEEFTQADSSITKNYQGTGLGLAICKRLASMLGGRIIAKSTKGVGSSFVLRIPARIENAEIDAAPKPAFDKVVPIRRKSDRGRVSVLVIEDDPNTRRMLTEIIESGGMRVITTGAGEEGIEIARRTNPDVITLDIFLNGLAGWDVLKRLKTDNALKHIPVVVCSASDDKRKIIAHGADEALILPVRKRDLLNAIRRHAPGKCNASILIVDNLPERRSTIARSLREHRFDMIEAEDVRDAFEKLQAAENIRAIILNAMMPEMDGPGFLEKLRKDENWRSLPVFVVAAQKLEPHERTALERSAETVIMRDGKPIDDLVGAITEQLSRYLEGAA